MIRINLLPFRQTRKKESIRRQVGIFLFSLIFIFIIVFSYNAYLKNKVKSIKNKVGETKIELAKYQKINKEITDIKKKLRILNKKVEVIKNLEIKRGDPVKLLNALTEKIIEKRMWLTNLKVTGNAVNIKGIALDNQTVADFMIRLEKSKHFSTIDLNTLKQKKVADSKLMSFIINCNKAPAVLKPANK